jgi:hypothetical protein
MKLGRMSERIKVVGMAVKPTRIENPTLGLLAQRLRLSCYETVTQPSDLLSLFSMQSLQKVRSKVQIMASREDGGKSLLQHSQFGAFARTNGLTPHVHRQFRKSLATILLYSCSSQSIDASNCWSGGATCNIIFAGRTFSSARTHRLANGRSTLRLPGRSHRMLLHSFPASTVHSQALSLHGQAHRRP